VKSLKFALLAGLAAASYAAPASADEIFGGLYKHDVETPLTKSGNIESGVDLMLGWRGGRIGSTPLQPYAYAALNSSGDTSYGAVGLSARFGDRVYVRPGLGVAVHTGSDADFENPFNDEVEFGSRILFAPELGVGVQISPRASAELSIVHLSHAQLFGKQNPGMDNIGVRVNLAF